VSGVRIKLCTAAFPVPIEAARDVGADSYHLKFMSPNGAFDMREVTLQTNQSAKTCMPASGRSYAERLLHAQDVIDTASIREKKVLCSPVHGHGRNGSFIGRDLLLNKIRPNKWLQRTQQGVIKLACASLPPALVATHRRR
jgi:hypothetical protein